jgi:hypothetical protein
MENTIAKIAHIPQSISRLLSTYMVVSTVAAIIAHRAKTAIAKSGASDVCMDRGVNDDVA